MKKYRKVYERARIKREKKLANRTANFALGDGYTEENIEKATVEMAEAGHFDLVEQVNRIFQ